MSRFSNVVASPARSSVNGSSARRKKYNGPANGVSAEDCSPDSSPTGRRRQRSSSSTTDPALGGPSSTSRLSRLRNSGGRTMPADAVASSGGTVSAVRASVRPSPLCARMATLVAMGRGACARCTTNRSASLVGGSSRAGRRCRSKPRSPDQRPAAPARRRKIAAVGQSVRHIDHRRASRSRTPGLPGTQSTRRGGTIGGPGLRLQGGEAGAQFGDRHFGRDGDRRTVAIRCGRQQRTLRPARSARSSSVSAASLRRAQSFAAAQPLSITSRTGPLPAKAEPASRTGRASARMTSAAAIMRNAISHQGVRAGVSSVAFSPNRKRTAGKSSDRGAGGVTRSSHHSMGSASRPTRTQGATNVGRASIYRAASAA